MKRLARARQTLLRLASALSLAATLAALVSLAPTPPIAASCAGAGSYHAAIVVEHGDGGVVSRCVAFDTAEIGGEELLNQSGIAWSGQTFSGFGVAVCALDGEPAQYSDCLSDRYWALFEARNVPVGGSWQLASTGLSGLRIHDGDAVGFRYVPASGTPAEPPSPAAVCAAAAPASPTTSPAQTPAAQKPAPSGPSGSDLGLLAAAAAAVALVGLCVLRLVVRRR